MTHRIALVTCDGLPSDADPDAAPLTASLERYDVEVLQREWEWNCHPASYDLCLLWSCWNYHLDAVKFARWIESTREQTILVNPLDIVLWNMHKSYLRELADLGVAVVPTLFCDAGVDLDLGRRIADEGWDELVIKPAVSASSHRTRRFGAGELEEAQAFLDDLLGRVDVLIQPYLRGVEDPRERSLIWIDGELTHAVRKTAWLKSLETAEIEVVPMEADEIALAESAMAPFGEQCLYARIDVVRDPRYGLVLCELELIEPFLFLYLEPRSVELLADALARRIGSRPRART